jgi:paired amphipathic helix protein Sin3a
MAVEPTEELDSIRLQYPYLKHRLARTEDMNEDERFEHIRHVDKITVSISPAMYTMKFIASEPFGIGGIQYFVQPMATAARSAPVSSEARKTLRDSRFERVRELMLQNNPWMKDLSQEEVEARKLAHKNDMEKPREAKKEGDADDIEMADS